MTTLRAVIMILGSLKKELKKNELTRAELDMVYSKLHDTLGIIATAKGGAK